MGGRGEILDGNNKLHGQHDANQENTKILRYSLSFLLLVVVAPNRHRLHR